VVEALPRLQLRDVTLALGALTLAPLRLPDVVLRPRQRPPRFDHGELGLAQRAHRTVVAILGLAISLIGEALGAHRVGQLAHPPLPGRQLLLGPLRFLHQALGAPRPLPARALARRLSSNTRSRAVSASTSLAGRCASCSSRCRKYLPSPVITSSCESSSASTAAYSAPSGRLQVGHVPWGPSLTIWSRCSFTSSYSLSSSVRLVSAYCRSCTHAVRSSSATRSAACSRSASCRAVVSARASSAATSRSSARRRSSSPAARPSSASCASSACRAAAARCSRSSLTT